MGKYIRNSIKNIRNLNLIAIFTALTAISAFIRIPLPYVPITLQTVFVLLAGIILGKKLGALSQLSYLLLGLAGAPIFTEGGGPAYILKPSFGYIIGFTAAAYICGLIIEKREINYQNVLIASTAGVFVYYLFGVPYLYLILSRVSSLDISFLETIKTGMIIFLPGDILKVFIVTLITPRIYKSIKRYL